jgi:hypothetical protein
MGVGGEKLSGVVGSGGNMANEFMMGEIVGY